MSPRHIFLVVGLIVGAFGALLLVQTGPIAVALGAVVGANLPSTRAFWYQLSFMRLFAVSLLGLAVLSVWAGSQLSATQQRSLGQILGGVFAVLAVMAVSQQIAIWDAGAGWEVSVVLGVVAAMCGLSAVTGVSKHAA